LKIEDQGAVPKAMGDTTSVTVSIDGGTPQSYRVPVGQTLDVPVVLDHAGQNVIQFSVAAEEGELTERNNAAVVQINGVRDRLRVLLVSGEPHPGERTWRNLLKSDSSVDLVHFTILRPPDKHDGVPVSELSLIAFPTRELFLDKIDEFDLIIFDRYKRRGILPSIYFDNVRNYVEKGGALLIAAGPDFAGAESIYRSPLADILPAEPSARVIEQGYRPEITDLGRRHPVTEGLKAEAGGAWGRWFRLIDLLPKQGEVVMSGIDDRPLLVLDRVGEGRVALLASDHAWLWSRGFEGGGPQLELLRRLAHWMMKEPELEEEALSATAEGQVMT
ncbi:glutamine amidotransferase, partial [Rhodovulum sulfidophilum]|nr:glutamine amidotransferase [Rhodovulum sulfidophilum]